MASVVIDVVDVSKANEQSPKKNLNESTSLLGSSTDRESLRRDIGLLGSKFQSMGYKR